MSGKVSFEGCAQRIKGEKERRRAEGEIPELAQGKGREWTGIED